MCLPVLSVDVAPGNVDICRIVYLTTGVSQTLALTAGAVNFSGTSAVLFSVPVSV